MSTHFPLWRHKISSLFDCPVNPSRNRTCAFRTHGSQPSRCHRTAKRTVIVTVEPEDFLSILHRQPEPPVVKATGGFFTTSYRYLSSYKGLPGNCEVVQARKIWIPG